VSFTVQILPSSQGVVSGHPAQSSVGPPLQVPVWQVSFCVQALPSSHVVPSTATGLEHAPVLGSQVPATWHGSLAEQVTAVPAHVPSVQVSLVVQRLPSLQLVPAGATGLEHWPLAGSQVPATWHGSLAEQVTAVPAHVPSVQVSLVVQRLPSLQLVPAGATGLEHWPLAGSQVPATWHGSLAVQVTFGGFEHVPFALQTSAVHGLPSLQTDGNRLQSFAHGPLKSPCARWVARAFRLMVMVWKFARLPGGK